MCSFAFKSNFFLISPQGCRDEMTALSPLPLFFIAVLSFKFGMFWDLQTNASHVHKAQLTVKMDFYFMLTHLLDVRLEILGCLVEPCVTSSLVPAECLRRLREGLWKDVYTLRLCPQSSVLLFSNKSFSQPALGFGLRGHADSHVGSEPSAFLKSPDFTRLKPQG